MQVLLFLLSFLPFLTTSLKEELGRMKQLLLLWLKLNQLFNQRLLLKLKLKANVVLLVVANALETNATE